MILLFLIIATVIIIQIGHIVQTRREIGLLHRELREAVGRLDEMIESEVEQ